MIYQVDFSEDSEGEKSSFLGDGVRMSLLAGTIRTKNMPEPKKSTKAVKMRKFIPPVIVIARGQAGRKPDPFPSAVKDLARVYDSFPLGRRHARMAAFLASPIVEGARVPDSLAAGGSTAQNDAYYLLAIHVAGVLIPAFDADEFSVLFRGALPPGLRETFTQARADKLLSAMCAGALIRLTRPANSKSFAEYAVVSRWLRPKQARS